MPVFNSRLYLEGYEADLSDNLNIANTYSLDNIKDITTITSDFSKTITLPGTANNTKLFNFLFDIKASTTAPFSYTGKNIGYNYSFIKQAKAVMIQDNQIILDGYAKLISATNTNGLVTYDIQISSELTSLVSVLAAYKLEDLYPSGITTPYDHHLTLSGITTSWQLPTVNPDPTNSVTYPFGRGYFYPLADYGDYETTNGTNFYTSTLRACLFAKTYWDEIFNYAGYTYSSNFLNSDYFQRLIIPYKDGDMLSLSTQSLFVAGASGSTAVSVLSWDGNSPILNHIYNLDAPPQYIGGKFTPNATGNYDFNTNFNFFFQLVVITPTLVSCTNTEWHVWGEVQVYNSDNSLSGTFKNDLVIANASYGMMTGTATTPTRFAEITVSAVPMLLGQYAKISVFADFPGINSFSSPLYTPGSPDAPFNNSFVNSNFVIDGSATLDVTFSSGLDLNTIEFSQFVPKDVKQIDFVTSILRLFNLYPVQDRDKPNHFNIYTREEFYSNTYDTPSFTYLGQKPIIDWTNKLDKNQSVTVTPIPNLSNSQLLLSYQADQDWYNTLYTSLWGSTYGQLTINTGYQFSQDELNVLDGIIFSPTPVVQYGNTISSNQAYNCEAYAEILIASQDTFSVAGYYTSTASGAGSLPTGSGFIHARKGVQVQYWGQTYTIINVINSQSFQVDRAVTRTGGAIDGTYYASSDTFIYVANNTKIIPAIYQTSDQNATRKPVAVNPRILYYGGLRGCNPYYIQYTPQTPSSGVTNTYPANPYWISGNTYPFCSHLNDDLEPVNDLLFFIPSKTFFNLNSQYPTVNMFNTFFQNQINELTDPDAKMLAAYFKLNSIDISNRDLGNSVYIDGAKYRVNEITDYIPDDSKTTSVELLRQPFQDYQFAYISASDSISGTTSTVSVGFNIGNLRMKVNPLSATSGQTASTTITGLFYDDVSLNISVIPLNPSTTYAIQIVQNGGIISNQIFMGTNTIAFPILILQGDIVAVNVVNAIFDQALINISENPGAASSITGVKIENANPATIPVTYLSGSTFPITSGQTGMYSTREMGSSQQTRVAVNQAIGDILTLTDSSGNTQTTTFSSSGATTIILNGVSVNQINPVTLTVNKPTIATIANSTSIGIISSVTGISGNTPTGSISAGSTNIHSYNPFTGSIVVNISQNQTGGSTLTLSKNGSTLQIISVPEAAPITKTFSSFSFVGGDTLRIDWTNGL